MKIECHQIKKIIRESIEEMKLDESILLALLMGCQGSDCNLRSVYEIEGQYSIPECVTEDIFDFDSLDWVGGVSPNELREICEQKGYEYNKFGPDFTDITVDITYPQVSLVIPNIPKKLVKYLLDLKIIGGSGSSIRDLDNFNDDQLINLQVFFIKYSNDLIVKNNFHLYNITRPSPANEDWDSLPYSVGMIAKKSNDDCQEVFDEFLSTFRGREQEELDIQLGLDNDDN